MEVADPLPELSEEAFRATFTEPVVALELAPEDQRGIVSAALGVLAARNAAVDVGEVAIQDSYELGGGAFFHHLVWYGVPKVYLVIVAGGGHALRGFHRLDLNEKYGLPPAEDAV